MSVDDETAECLFALLSLQLGFINCDEFIALFRQARNSGIGIEQQLIGSGCLSPNRIALIHSAVNEHVRARNTADSSSTDDLPPKSASSKANESAVVPEESTSCLIATMPQSALDRLNNETQKHSPLGTRFQVLRTHARGGIGQISVAIDHELHREVALKQILPQFADDNSSRTRFVLEAEVTGRLEHPGIVPVYGLGEDGSGRPFYAMRFVRGESLNQSVDALHAGRKGQSGDWNHSMLALRTLLTQFVAVCNTVEYAHSRGVIHRDIKPANILLGPYRETLVVDWGLAKIVGRSEPASVRAEATLRPATTSGSSETQLGSVIGTPAYMSPEQAEGRPDGVGAASDVYSLGATLFYILTGKVPFEGTDVLEVLARVRRGQFLSPRRVNSWVPPGLEAICLKAMSLSPGDRYLSARDLADDLERWLGDQPVTAHSEPIAARLGRWGRQHKPLVTGAMILGLTALSASLVGTFLIGREQGRTQQALTKLLEAQHERALARVDSLLHANAHALPTLINDLSPERSWIDPRLHELLRQDLAPELKRRVRLALLPVDPGQADALGRDLPDCPIDEFAVLREGLYPHRDRLAPNFWRIFRDTGESPRRRFFAGMALAGFDVEDRFWTSADVEFLAIQLLYAGLDDQLSLRRFLDPIARRLIPTIQAKSSDETTREVVRESAAAALAEYGRDDPSLLADVISRSSSEQYPLLSNVLKQQGARRTEFVEELAAIAGRQDGKAMSETAILSEGRRRSTAAVALFDLGASEKALAAFRGHEYPDTVSQFAHQVRQRGIRASDLLRAIENAKNPDARYALFLAFGEYPLSEFAEPDRVRLLSQLRDTYAHDPSNGIHGVAGWLLRNWGQHQASDSVDQSPLPFDPLSDRRWYIEAVGDDRLTFVVCPPGEFLMGSPANESDRDNDEDRHPVTLTRPFAISAYEISVKQFNRFLRATGREPLPAESNLRAPALDLTWYEAVEYCRWVTQQAGMRDSAQCYDDPTTLVKGSDGFPMDWTMNTERLGFRLPTEAEWEYACRAGTTTSFNFGNDRSLLRYYAWYQDNSGRGAHNSGELRPNFWGIFDLYGNAAEWCNDRFLGYETSLTRDPMGGKDSEFRVYRGGTWTGGPRLCRSADRDLGSPTDRALLGFRLARTIPASR